MRRLRPFVFAALIVAFVLLSGLCAHAAHGNPVTERQLLSWIIADIPVFDLQTELHARGVNFSLDESWRASLKQAGASASLMKVLEKVPPAAAAVAPDECADRLFRVVREVNTKKFEAAQMHMTALAHANPSDADLQIALGGTMGRRDSWGEAVLAFMAAAQLDPDSGFAHQLLSYASYHTGDADFAVKEAKAAVILRPSDSNSYRYLGIAYDKRREYQKSAAAYEQALRLKPNYSEVFYDIGGSLANQGHLREAVEAYQKAISFDGSHWNYYYNMGNALADLSRWDEAIAAQKRAKDLAPDKLEIRQNLGSAYCNSGRSQEAVSEFQELLTMDPDWNMARLCLYKSLVRLGRSEEANQVKEDYDKMASAGSE
jgi:tetratricopeptide (TPR) repeat protein